MRAPPKYDAARGLAHPAVTTTPRPSPMTEKYHLISSVT